MSTAPPPTAPTEAVPAETPARSRWRRLVPRTRAARGIAAAVAALLIALLGFGAGYAVGHDDRPDGPPGFSRDFRDGPRDGRGGPPQGRDDDRASAPSDGDAQSS